MSKEPRSLLGDASAENPVPTQNTIVFDTPESATPRTAACPHEGLAMPHTLTFTAPGHADESHTWPIEAAPAGGLRAVADIVKRHTHQGMWAMTRFAGEAPEEDCLLCRSLVSAGVLTLDQIGAGSRAALAAALAAPAGSEGHDDPGIVTANSDGTASVRPSVPAGSGADHDCLMPSACGVTGFYCYNTATPQPWRDPLYPDPASPSVTVLDVLARVRETYKPQPPAGEWERLDGWNDAVASIERWLVAQTPASPSAAPLDVLKQVRQAFIDFWSDESIKNDYAFHPSLAFRILDEVAAAYSEEGA